MAILIFDFDSTLVSVEALDELFARSLDGAPDRDRRVAAFQEITDLGMAGEIDADESLARRLSLLQADRSLVNAVGTEVSKRLSPSVARNIEFFRERPGRIHVVSGGFEELISPTLDLMGIPEGGLRAHRFRYGDSDRVLGLDPETIMARGGKPAAVESIAPGRSEELWMIGDGATDLELRELGLVDRFVAFTENRHRDPVVAKADDVVRSMDELLELLEIR